jgi:dihydroorotate dehydrogenase
VTLYAALFNLVLRRLQPEQAHRLAAVTLRAACRIPGCAVLLRRLLATRDPVLGVQALGLNFPSPLGVAAGLDKDASFFEGLGLLGFGFVEVGTVTVHPQPGNPPPRVFRVLRDRALLNRMGFPNPGAAAVAARLRGRRGCVVVGANVGKSMVVPLERAAGDYCAGARALAPVCDYLVVNVSSPNTPGLKQMQALELLRPLLRDVQRELRETGAEVPLLVKLGPDLADAQLLAIPTSPWSSGSTGSSRSTPAKTAASSRTRRRWPGSRVGVSPGRRCTRAPWRCCACCAGGSETDWC